MSKSCEPMFEVSDKELLNYAIKNSIIDINTVKKKIQMKEYQDYLDKHNSRVWQSTDGNWYTYLPEKDRRRLVKRKNKKDLENLIVDFYRAAEKEPYLVEVFNEWIEKKLKYGEIQRQSYDRYKSDFNRFFVGSPIYKIKLKYVSEEMLEEFIKTTIHDMELTAKSWSGLRTLINGIFRYAKKMGYTTISITQFMGDLDISRKAFKKRKFSDEESVFTDEEVKMINNYINEREPSIAGLGILLMFETGLRVGEISAIKWEDVSDGLLSVNKREIHYKDDKGNYIYEVVDDAKTDAGTRKIVLSQNAQILLKRIRLICPFGEYVFMRNGSRIRGNYFSKRLSYICRIIGITPRSGHKARKTYATKLINAGLNDNLIISQMGHTDIATTKRHYYFNNLSLSESRREIEQAIKYG